MAAGDPEEPDDNLLRGRATMAALCQVAGVALAIATLVCSLLAVISAQQAVALGLPAVVLILGGLIAVWVPDHQTGRRLGYQVGRVTGALLNLWRSLAHRRQKGP